MENLQEDDGEVDDADEKYKVFGRTVRIWSDGFCLCIIEYVDTLPIFSKDARTLQLQQQNRPSINVQWEKNNIVTEGTKDNDMV